MGLPVILLESIGKSLIKHGKKAAKELLRNAVPGGSVLADIVPDLAEDVWNGWSASGKADKLLKRLHRGTIMWFGIVIGLVFVSWPATLVVFVAPLIITRIAMMAGNWGQHAFVDARDPENCYLNSITCITAVTTDAASTTGTTSAITGSRLDTGRSTPRELQDNLRRTPARARSCSRSWISSSSGSS